MLEKLVETWVKDGASEEDVFRLQADSESTVVLVEIGNIVYLEVVSRGDEHVTVSLRRGEALALGKHIVKKIW